MKKKIICLFLIFLLLLPLSATAEYHLSVRCRFPSSDNEQILGDVYYEKDHFFLTSSLFEGALLFSDLPGEPDHDMIQSMIGLAGPHSFRTAVSLLKDLLSSWSSEEWNGSRKGLFAGDLFDKASSVKEADLTNRDFAEFPELFIASLSGTDVDQSVSRINRFLSLLTEKLFSFLSHRGIQLHLKSYDCGKYAVLELQKEPDTMMTFSADFSRENELRILSCRSEEGKMIFKRYTVELMNDRTEITADLFIGSDPVFQNTGENDRYISEKLSIVTKMDNQYSFSYSIAPKALNESFLFTGTIQTADDYKLADMEGKACFSLSEGSILEVSIALDDQTKWSNDHGQQIYHSANKDDMNAFRSSTGAGLLLLAARVLPDLPAEYQKILYNMIYSR